MEQHAPTIYLYIYIDNFSAEPLWIPCDYKPFSIKIIYGITTTDETNIFTTVYENITLRVD